MDWYVKVKGVKRMSSQYYDLCCKHHGRVVTIRERNGNKHVGRIAEINRTHVYLELVSPQSRRNLGGFGYGFYHPYGFGRRRFVPIALAAIGGFALGAAFFW
jgi:hypothetical protein